MRAESFTKVMTSISKPLQQMLPKTRWRLCKIRWQQCKARRGQNRHRKDRLDQQRVHQTKAGKVSKSDSALEASDEDVDSEEHHVYVINKEKQLQIEDTVTLQIAKSEIFLQFQIDTRADVNVFPVLKYLAATGDIEMHDVRPSPLPRLTSFNSDKTAVVGCIELAISRYDKKSRILVNWLMAVNFERQY